VEQEGREMKLAQRILITALAFVVGIALMPLAPFLMAWLFWGETDDDGEDGQ
jgi:hypothetical protein